MMERDARRTGDGYELLGPLVEMMVLQQAAWQIVDLLEREDESREEPDNPFDAWADQMQLVDDGSDEDEDSPIERRLFPNPYPDDPRAADEYRRYTRTDQRRTKVREAYQVIDDVDHAVEETMVAHGWSDQRQIRGGVPACVRIPAERFDVWLRTLNVARLTLSVHLNIRDEDDAERIEDLWDDEDHPQAMTAAIYTLLGLYQSLLLDC